MLPLSHSPFFPLSILSLAHYTPGIEVIVPCTLLLKFP